MDILTTQKVTAAVSFVDAQGLAATAPGPVAWSVDQQYVTLQPSADGLSCEVLGASAGSCTITATSGNLSCTGTVNATAPVPVAGPAVSMSMTFGVPVAQ